MNDRLDELIKELEHARDMATEGEMEVGPDNYGYGFDVYIDFIERNPVRATIADHIETEGDAQSIATRHNTAPLVLQELNRLNDALGLSMALNESLQAHRTELTRERDTANRQMERADEESVRFRAFYEDHQDDGTGAARVNELTRERDEARETAARLFESLHDRGEFFKKELQAASVDGYDGTIQGREVINMVGNMYVERMGLCHKLGLPLDSDMSAILDKLP